MGLKLLDTDVLVDVRRKFPPASAWFQSLSTYPAVPGFVALELFAGCRDKLASEEMAAFLRPFPIIWPSPAGCNSALGTFPQRHLAQNLGVLDAMIAATAMDVGGTLYTFNTKHFRAVSGLIVEQPYSRSQPSASP